MFNTILQNFKPKSFKLAKTTRKGITSLAERKKSYIPFLNHYDIQN